MSNPVRSSEGLGAQGERGIPAEIAARDPNVAVGE